MQPIFLDTYIMIDFLSVRVSIFLFREHFYSFLLIKYMEIIVLNCTTLYATLYLIPNSDLTHHLSVILAIESFSDR